MLFLPMQATSEKGKRKAREQGVAWHVNDKRKPRHTKKKRVNLSHSQKKRNRKNSTVRARVEHCFRVLKQQFGYGKTRYKGLEKNRTQVMTLLGLTNLYIQRVHLLA